MGITTVLFDLDGTLLPMDQDEFTEGYFRLLARKLAPYGYEPKLLVDTIWSSVAAMVRNDGSRMNEETFWNKFSEVYGEKAIADRAVFEEFYVNEFQGAKACCGFNPKAAEAVKFIKKAGLRTVLATNPVFPAVATESRIRWAGLASSDFELYTTYENIGYCKPNPDYYRDILRRLKLNPEECLMVGNDVSEDMVAGTLGIKVFLLTDCLINKEGVDIGRFPHGGYSELLKYIEKEKG